MATNMATIIDPDSREAVGVKNEAVMDVEYPATLAYTSEPVLCLAGTISVIRPGRRDLALSDAEWQDLELLGLSESPEARELLEAPESPRSEDVTDGK